MTDAVLFESDGRFALRFVRELPHPVDAVWQAVTSPEGLATWFPFDVIGERATGASLEYAFRAGEGEPFSGTMVEFTPRSAMELRWDATETLRLELRAAGGGSELTLLNRFDAIGKAARDAAGWHARLDALSASLSGGSIDIGERWGAVHPGYVERFGPEASTIGPPG